MMLAGTRRDDSPPPSLISPGISKGENSSKTKGYGTHSKGVQNPHCRKERPFSINMKNKRSLTVSCVSPHCLMSGQKGGPRGGHPGAVMTDQWASLLRVPAQQMGLDAGDREHSSEPNAGLVLLLVSETKHIP